MTAGLLGALDAEKRNQRILTMELTWKNVYRMGGSLRTKMHYHLKSL